MKVSIDIDKCVRCKYMNCVDSCPVEAIYVKERYPYVDKSKCIECGCCNGARDSGAIIFEDD